MQTPDRVLHVTLHVPLTAETKDPINERLLMKMPKGCHTDQRCAPREGARGERHWRFSAEDQASVTSPMRHPRQVHEARLLHQEERTQADNRIISIRVHRTALRHPVVSTSNAEPVRSKRSPPSTSSTSSQRREGYSHRTLFRKSLHRLHSSIGQLSYSPSRSKERR